jgi:hypothetical protein
LNGRREVFHRGQRLSATRLPPGQRRHKPQPSASVAVPRRPSGHAQLPNHPWIQQIVDAKRRKALIAQGVTFS